MLSQARIVAREDVWTLPVVIKPTEWLRIAREGIALDHRSIGSGDGTSEADAVEVRLLLHDRESTVVTRLGELCNHDLPLTNLVIGSLINEPYALGKVVGPDIAVLGDAVDFTYYRGTNLLLVEGPPAVLDFTGEQLRRVGALPVQESMLQPYSGLPVLV